MILLITRLTQVTILFVAGEFNEKIFTASVWGFSLYDLTLGSCVFVFLLITCSAQVTVLLVACEFNEKYLLLLLGDCLYTIPHWAIVCVYFYL